MVELLFFCQLKVADEKNEIMVLKHSYAFQALEKSFQL
jgi:hypothetical protein